MALCDIYYYFVALAMIAGVIIAYVLRLDIDQGPHGRIRFGHIDFTSKLGKRVIFG